MAEARATAGADQRPRPAFYAAGPGRLRDWWTLLHPPFTAWHLSYVVLGAMLAPQVRLDRLVAALIAFFLAGALALGALGISRAGWALLPFMIVGPLLVVGYNAELFGGIIHTDLGFAVSWGAFPTLTGYVAEAGRLTVAPVLAATAAMAISAGQRHLSTPARTLRRRAVAVTGSMTMADGSVAAIDARRLLEPLERALRSFSWGLVLLAAALAVARLA